MKKKFLLLCTFILLLNLSSCYVQTPHGEHHHHEGGRHEEHHGEHHDEHHDDRH